MQVEIFKTNVQAVSDSHKVTGKLLEFFSDYQIHFDLNDCDKILRIEANSIDKKSVIDNLESIGFTCELLED